MKILRALALLAVGAGAMGLAGCGDGGVQSPDFTRELIGLSIDAPDATPDGSNTDPDVDQFVLAVGDSVDLVATGNYSVPPGSNDQDNRPVEATFTVDRGNLATISGQTLTATGAGLVVVDASAGDVDSTNTLTFRIVAPVLESIAISPDTATVSEFGGFADYSVLGTFSDGSTRPLSVNWTVEPAAGVVALSPPSGQNTRATPVTGSRGLNATLFARTTANDRNGVLQNFEDDAQVVVSNEDLVAITGVRPSNRQVAPGGAVDFTATGTYSDGTTSRPGDVQDSLIDWSSSNTASAAFLTPDDLAAGRATGQAPGGSTTVITATLKTGVAPAATPRTASTNLFVTDARCVTPLLGPPGGTATSVQAPGACAGCSATNAGAVIDGDMNTFATLSIPLAVGVGSVGLNVDSNAADIVPAGTPAGFVVAKPLGLLTTEVLSGITISTRNNGAVVENSGTATSVSLLGLIGGQDAALVSFVPTQPFDGLTVDFSGGVISLLASVNVFQACSSAVDTTP